MHFYTLCNCSTEKENEGGGGGEEEVLDWASIETDIGLNLVRVKWNTHKTESILFHWITLLNQGQFGRGQS